MIRKTQGIVLRQHPYADNKRIVNIFTREAGKKSFVVYNSSSKNKMGFYQLLFVLNLEFQEKQNKTIHTIKEVSISRPYSSIPYTPEKTSIVFFIAEILNKIIDEGFVDERFFDFVVNSMYLLDESEKPANFHIAFMSALSIFLGIMPEFNFSAEDKFFDIREGCFVSTYTKGYCMDEYTSAKFNHILDLGMTDFDKVSLNQNERNILLSKLIGFYAFNFNGFNNLKSVEVLNEVFR